MYAITPNGIGEPVGARQIRPGASLISGETFTVDTWEPSMVLAEDGVSLRYPTPAEISAQRAALIEKTRVADIEAEANERVSVWLPDGPNGTLTTKINLVARFTDIIDKSVAGLLLTPSEIAERDQLRSVWRTKIYEIRKLEKAALTNGDSVDTFRAALDAAGL